MKKRWDYQTIIHRLGDLKGLSLIPEPGERAGEWSSTDRRSRYDEPNDRYEDWGANDDGSGTIADSGDGGKIIAQMDGPGCIWRIWTAQALSGHVKMVIDGVTVIDQPFEEYFDPARGPFPFEGLCYYSAGGRNCYVPIPYNRSCRIIAYGGWGAYYQINYTTFPEGTDVESFRLPLTRECGELLTYYSGIFSGRLSHYPVMEDGRNDTQSFIVPAKGEAVVFSDHSAGAVKSFRIRADGAGCPLNQVFKELIVAMYWDQNGTPSVWSALGDFFGCSCGKTPYKTLPLGLDDDGWFYCRFFMPYQTGAKSVIGNDGGMDHSVHVQIIKESLEDVGRYLRFHAKWNQDAFPVTRPDRRPDYTVLKVNGNGRFVGLSLHVAKYYDNDDPDAGEGGYWWGEGDDKIFVDGEKYPSCFGTGTEDYFGFAWALPELFSKAYHAQIYNEGGIHDKGNRSLIRFHIMDSIPFHKSLEMCLEKYYSDKYARYGAVAYWYGDSDDGYSPRDLKTRTDYYWSDQKTRDGIPDRETLDLTESAVLKGEAFLNAKLVKGPEGTYLECRYAVNSGTASILQLKEFVMTTDLLTFRIAGSERRDPCDMFISLVDLDEEKSLIQISGNSTTLREIVWNVSNYRGKHCALWLVDEGKGNERWLKIADIRI